MHALHPDQVAGKGRLSARPVGDGPYASSNSTWLLTGDVHEICLPAAIGRLPIIRCGQRC